MSELDRQQEGRRLEGLAFTFCKAGFLVFLFRQYSLLALSGLAALFYLLALQKGVKEWRCFLKPPWVVVWWLVVFAAEAARIYFAHMHR